MKAVISINGIQYLVSEGQELVVSKLNNSSPLVFSQVLALLPENQPGSEIVIGSPYLKDVTVSAEKITDLKGEKIRTLKYKAKSRYRKVTGFRAALTKIKILTIGKPTPSEKASPIKNTKPVIKKIRKSTSEK